MPGWYRFDIPDVCLADGADFVGIHFRGAANMVPLPLEIQLTHKAAASETMYIGAAASGSTTTQIVDAGLTQSANNHWNGRVVLFLTGSLAYQGSNITGFDAATDTLTVAGFTGAPSVGDKYIIV